MRKKILMITGSYPPDPCGVGDYTQRLVEKLKKYEKIEVEIFKLGKFNVKESYKIFKYFIKNKDTIKILQYPTLGYGWNMLPQILTLIFSKNMYVNLHEFSQRKMKAKLATKLFFFSKAHIIFTTNDERESAIKIRRAVKDRSSVVRIGSNIEFVEVKQKTIDLIYFGIIMPNKGLEDFIEIASQLREKNSEDKIVIIGRKQDEKIEYFQKITYLCKKSNIELIVDSSSEKVSQILAKSKIAFLPFPDGVTFRRGSLLACLGNQVKVISYPNKMSCDYNSIKKLCKLIDKKEEFFQQYEKLKEDVSIFQTNEYKNFLKDFNWEGISRKIKNIIVKG